MPAMRELLRMTDGEIAAFIEERRRAQIGTLNRDGSVHLVPMNYLLWDGRLALWTEPASQKIANLRRDPRITALVESGDAFEEFRAVQLRGTARLVDDLDDSRRAGELLFARSRGELTDELRDDAAMLASQRVLVVVEPDAVVSWDHRKMAGVRPDQIGS
jgi:PPOX class probable F420-dependent enzyme